MLADPDQHDDSGAGDSPAGPVELPAAAVAGLVVLAGLVELPRPVRWLLADADQHDDNATATAALVTARPAAVAGLAVLVGPVVLPAGPVRLVAGRRRPARRQRHR